MGIRTVKHSKRISKRSPEKEVHIRKAKQKTVRRRRAATASGVLKLRKLPPRAELEKFFYEKQ